MTEPSILAVDHPTSDSFVIGCMIKAAPHDPGPLFVVHKDGSIIARLRGYAVIPVEDYWRMCRPWWRRWSPL